ncbi:4-(cytidine 5'-diphospho)-2-C-methyl-D-erythritol kinase [Helicobacter colisuis]|uniref:4-(cytidine 5'-diphospho)-2-C-methyl-D-erythritol kinase n=1 Tax=Helicobacter colisuis TaxID=2949739 RepID=UPI00202AB482|nr:4-(cytidine 5'-diphospho)-2-C-methyl-D-erythritol kinase [Helicobacter colisuis]MCL9822234.1 4-(cytidine 5'-diphospho)-2-C-methyl-D-erythritol kinase [Helicobacter colisuis]
MIKSYAKINIFLKITGRVVVESVKYHTLYSRFMLVKNLFDCLEIQESKVGFEILGDFDCPMEKNTIYKVYEVVLPLLNQERQEFLSHQKIEVEKKIPSGAGLGGGSSNAAAFLLWINEVLELRWSFEKLNEIAQKVGSDVPFFVSQYEVADVSGRGEKIFKSREKALEVEIVTPKIHCDTTKVYQTYAKDFYEPTQENWLEFSNAKILRQSPYENNDLLNSAIKLYPSLKEYVQQGYFLSGSGSSFWKVKE